MFPLDGAGGCDGKIMGPDAASASWKLYFFLSGFWWEGLAKKCPDRMHLSPQVTMTHGTGVTSG